MSQNKGLQFVLHLIQSSAPYETDTMAAELRKQIEKDTTVSPSLKRAALLAVKEACDMYVAAHYNAQRIDKSPAYCPHCGGKKIAEVVNWKAKSLEPTDASNTAELTEYQCWTCNGLSFWIQRK